MDRIPSPASKLVKSILDGDGGLAVSRIEARARIRFTVAQALAQGRVSFHYQPVVRADNPRFPAFHEMLARLRTLEGQLLAAGAFLPLVAESEIGRAIDRLALSSALKALAANPGLRLSINLSPLSMGDEEWLAILGVAARGGSGICGRLILEITEDAAVAHAGQTIDFMNHVRRSGCAFALDDFGAGATGFRHFRDFRFDMVKIDGAFVQGIDRAADSQVLVDCLLQAARHFEMVTVAERVETVAEADWLHARGIDCFQGYLFGRPVAQPQVPGQDDQRARAAG